jgi:hypothetical protein
LRPIEREIEQTVDDGKKQVLSGYAQVIRTAWTVKRTSEWDQGGACAVALCQGVQKSLEQAVATHDNAVLESLLDMTKLTNHLVEKACQIKERQDEIRATYATIFVEPETLAKLSPAERIQLSVDRAAKLAAVRDDFFIRSKQLGDDASWANHCFKVTNSFGPYLLKYIEVPGMPCTNNGIEQEFGHIRTKLRRTTGRQNNHDFIYRHGEYMALTLTNETLQDITARISNVNDKNKHVTDKTLPHLT